MCSCGLRHIYDRERRRNLRGNCGVERSTRCPRTDDVRYVPVVFRIDLCLVPFSHDSCPTPLASSHAQMMVHFSAAKGDWSDEASIVDEEHRILVASYLARYEYGL